MYSRPLAKILVYIHTKPHPNQMFLMVNATWHPAHPAHPGTPAHPGILRHIPALRRPRDPVAHLHPADPVAGTCLVTSSMSASYGISLIKQWPCASLVSGIPAPALTDSVLACALSSSMWASTHIYAKPSAPGTSPAFRHIPDTAAHPRHNPGTSPALRRIPDTAAHPRHIPDTAAHPRHIPDTAAHPRHILDTAAHPPRIPDIAAHLRHIPGTSLTLRHIPGTSLTLRHIPGTSLTLRHIPGTSLTLRHIPGTSPVLRHIPGAPAYPRRSGTSPALRHIPGTPAPAWSSNILLSALHYFASKFIGYNLRNCMLSSMLIDYGTWIMHKKYQFNSACWIKEDIMYPIAVDSKLLYSLVSS